MADGRFTSDVEDVLRALRPGQIVTYGEVAAEVGRPGAARAVGMVLRSSRGLPWWRVVAANGRVNPHAVEEATRLLRAEGVEVCDGRVTRRRRLASAADGYGACPQREERAMSDDGGRVPDDTPAAPERSAAKVDDAVDTASAGRAGGGTLRPATQSQPGTAPVEQAADDEQMTQGRSGAASGDVPAAPEVPPGDAAVSGGMQSDPGARVSDHVAATTEDED